MKRQYQGLFYRKVGSIFDKNHGLTPLEIHKFFAYSKITFLWSKKPPFEKTASSTDKMKVSFTET